MARRAFLMFGGAALGGALLVAFSALTLLASTPGHDVLRRILLKALAKAVTGRVTIGSVGGSLWRGAELRDVTLETADGRPAIRVRRVAVRFALSDLVRSRYRFHDIVVDHPVVVLEQSPDGKWNVERLFGQAGPHGTAAVKRPYVELRNARVLDGTVIVRERKAEGSVVQRQLEGFTADLSRLRLSHPDSAAIEATFRNLAARVTNPKLDLRKADGTAALAGDSLRFAFAHVGLPATAATASGTVRWGPAHTRLEASVDARRFAFADVRSLVPIALPTSGGGAVQLRLRVGTEGVTELDLGAAEFATGRSALTTRTRLTIGPRGALRVHELDAQLHPLDLALIGLYARKVPVRGLVRGHVTAAGPLGDLAVTSDVRWQDEAAAGAAPNAIVGHGRLAIGGGDEVTFGAFALERADVAVATITQFAPSVDLPGRLHLAGTLDGPWRAATFNGMVVHADTGAVASLARGTVRIGIADTAVVDADMDVDSLSLALLRRRFPAIPLLGVLSGRAHVHGPVSGMAIDAALAGAAGRFTARGSVGSRDSSVRLALVGTFDSLDLSSTTLAGPPSAFGGDWAADLEVPRADPAGATGSAQVLLRGGVLSGVALRGGALAITPAPGRVGLDSLRLDFDGGSARASGGLGRGHGLPARLEFAVRADTAAYLEPLVRWLRRTAGDSSVVRLEGAAQLTGHLEGMTDRWRLEAAASTRGLELGGDRGRGITASFRVDRSDGSSSIRASAAADSVTIAGLLYAAVGLSASGPLDSLAVHLTSGFHVASAMRAAFTVSGGSREWRLHLDTLDLDLPLKRWHLAAPALLVVSDSALRVAGFDLVAAGGTGRARAAGVLPRSGEASFELDADSIPLVDVWALLQRDTSRTGGVIDGTLRLGGLVDSPVVDVRGSLTGATLGDYQLPLVQVEAHYRDERLALEGGLLSDSTRLVSVTGSLPLHLALKRERAIHLKGPVDIVARADSLDLKVLNSITRLVTDLEGTGTLDVRVSGTWDEPKLAGSVDIRGGAVRVPSLGARYSDIDARLELADDIMRVSRASLSSGGRLDIAGQVRFENLTRPVLDLQLTASQFAAFDIRNFGALTATGALALRGPAIGSTLSGGIEVDAGSLQFKDLVEKRVVSLDDPEFRALVDTNLARASELGPAVHTVFLDSLRIEGLTVALGSDVWLRSSEANIQLEGEFDVARSFTGGSPRYRLDGTLHAVRGTYRLTLGKENSFLAITRDFRVSRGTVQFFGTPDFNPELDIVAEHVVRTGQGTALTVRANIGGTLLVPELHLTSDAQPPLSETEIASYLMFGQPPATLAESGVGGRSEAALAQAVGSSLVGGVGQALVSELGLPLDYLTIVPGAVRSGATPGQSSARVEAGAQLGERTFLTLNAGLCEVLASQLVGATLEYRLGGRWTASAAFEPVVQECGTSAGLTGLAGKKQIGFDLFWQQGIR